MNFKRYGSIALEWSLLVLLLAACKPNLSKGIPCGEVSVCSSGYCVDGVCCENACDGLCESCSAAQKGGGVDGICEPYAGGTDPENECALSCNGAGACQLSDIGKACETNTECNSSHCVDGVCCDSPCNGTCMACTAAQKGGGVDGECGTYAVGTDPENECVTSCNGAAACWASANGNACSADIDCNSGFCVDGVCCNIACNAPCKTCNAPGFEGICSNVPAGQTDSNANPACNDICDGEGSCPLSVGAACQSGLQCTSRVCDNQVCAAVTPPSTLAWMTILRTNPPDKTIDLSHIETSDFGVSGGGGKAGFFQLGPFTLGDCCWNEPWWFDFSATGVPQSIDDFFATDMFNTYTYTHYPMRYGTVTKTYYQFHMGTGHSNSTSISTPRWGRTYGYTQGDVVAIGDAGHLVFSGGVTPDDQNQIYPVDFGDGIPVTGGTAKYSPNGSLERFITGGKKLGPIIDAMGNFYDISRTDSTLTIAKQDVKGDPLWTHTYSIAVNAGANPTLGRVFDLSGNLFLAFNFAGSVDLGNGPMTATGIHDLGLAKFDSNGNALWTKHFGTSTFDLQSLKLNPTGNDDLLVSASFAGMADFGDGPFAGTNVLVKFDNVGGLIWRTIAPAPASIVLKGSPQGAAVIGTSNKTVDFGWGTLLGPMNDFGMVVAQYGPCADPKTCRNNGSPCIADTQCASSFCVDGVCCENACTGTCQACSADAKGQGVDGTCGNVVAGADPDEECMYACNDVGACAEANGLTCTNEPDCVSGHCVDGFCCNTACSDPCLTCSMVKKGGGVDGSCGPIAMGTDPDQECGSGTCSGVKGCVNAGLGIACTNASECASGFCVDGVCCNGACDKICWACSAAKTGAPDGTCSYVKPNTDPDLDCPYGICGPSETYCTYAKPGDPCFTGYNDCDGLSCIEGVCCDSNCSGTCKSCLASKKGYGTDGVCGYIARATDPDQECASNQMCGGDGKCKLNNGLSCVSPDDCVSSHCVDGVCCDSACNGKCQACSAATKSSGLDGVCGQALAGTNPGNRCVLECDAMGGCMPAPNGSACANAGECTSGFCVDGYCCNANCTGLCEACSAAKSGNGLNGECSFIASGKDPENECAGTCNGAGVCGPPPVLASNGASCTGGIECNSGYCIDGVCCDSACDETCKTCTKQGLVGTCSPRSAQACNVCGGIMKLPTMPTSGPEAHRMVLADLNQDGFVDAATINVNAVAIKLGNGSGVFTQWAEFPVGLQPNQIASGDLNHDGTVDLVTANDGEPTVSVLLNNGDGSFLPAVNIPVARPNLSVVLTDVNGDGNLDIVVGYGMYVDGTTPGLGTLLGDGFGGFAVVIDAGVPGGTPKAMTAAEMTGDGIVDLALINYSTSGPAPVYRGIGDGTFVLHDTFPITDPNELQWPSDIAAADLDGDGFTDLAVAVETDYNGKVLTYFNLGTGIFANPFTATVPMTAESLDVVDINGDGRVDVVASGTFRATGFSILWNDGAQLFTNSFYRTSAMFFQAKAVDIDVDGSVDILGVTNAGLFPVMNPGNGEFDKDASKTADSTVRIVDLNLDGYLDFVRVNAGVTVAFNQGDDTFGARVPYGLGDAIDLADVNGDGKLDLIAVYSSLNIVGVRMNGGTGSFGAEATYATGLGPVDVVAVDLTGDGKRDLAVLNGTANSFSFLRNNGNGTFAAKVDFPTATGPTKIAAADMDDDNVTDLVIGAKFATNIDIAHNQGNGTFVLTDLADIPFGIDFVVKDLDGNGKSDLVVAGSKQVSIRLNQGGGVFGPEAIRALFGANLQMATADVQDMDGDGLVDICVHTQYHSGYGTMSSNMSVLFNQGSGSFGSSRTYMTWARSAADFNGDGLLDGLNVDATTAIVKYGTCQP